MNKVLLLVSFLMVVSCRNNDILQNEQMKYYSNINEAEIYYLKKDFKKSILFYERAFSLKCSQFIKDKYNYMRLSCFLGNKINYLSISNELLNCGVNKEFLISKISCIKNDWLNQIDINNNIRDSIEDAINYDQKARKKGYSNFTIETDSLNYLIIQNIIEGYEFPSERQIGINDSIEFLNPFHFLIWHQRTYELRANKLIKQIELATKKGKIHPNIAGKLIWVLSNGEYEIIPDPIYSVGYIRSDLKEYFDSDFYSPILNEKHVDEVNSIRNKIGMEPYHDQITKQILSKKDTLLRWYYSPYTVFMYDDSIQMVAKINNSECVILTE